MFPFPISANFFKLRVLNLNLCFVWLPWVASDIVHMRRFLLLLLTGTLHQLIRFFFAKVCFRWFSLYGDSFRGSFHLFSYNSHGFRSCAIKTISHSPALLSNLLYSTIFQTSCHIASILSKSLYD